MTTLLLRTVPQRQRAASSEDQLWTLLSAVASQHADWMLIVPQWMKVGSAIAISHTLELPSVSRVQWATVIGRSSKWSTCARPHHAPCGSHCDTPKLGWVWRKGSFGGNLTLPKLYQHLFASDTLSHSSLTKGHLGLSAFHQKFSWFLDFS